VLGQIVELFAGCDGAGLLVARLQTMYDLAGS
jgi:hypothetical protein